MYSVYFVNKITEAYWLKGCQGKLTAICGPLLQTRGINLAINCQGFLHTESMDSKDTVKHVNTFFNRIKVFISQLHRHK